MVPNIKGKTRNKIIISNCQMEGVIKIIVPHLQEVQSKEINQKLTKSQKVCKKFLKKCYILYSYN